MSDLKKILLTLAEKSRDSNKADEAMKYSQSALNMAHAIATLAASEKHNS